MLEDDQIEDPGSYKKIERDFVNTDRSWVVSVWYRRFLGVGVDNDRHICKSL